jgi:phytol kinase
VAVSIGLFFMAFFIFYKKRKILETVYKKNGDNYGVIFFPLGLIMSFILFVPINPIIFQGSVLVLALSDGLAGLLGLKFGQKKYKVTGEKTWLGSLFFFIMTLLILLCIFYIANGSIHYLNILVIMFASLVLTIIEGLFGKGFDNLLLPVTSGYIIYYLLSL